MSAPTMEKVAAGGTVFDIGYRGYAGRREGRGRGRRAVFTDGVRIALGLGRGPRAKLLPWSFFALLSGIALIMALVAGAAERLGGPGAAQELNLPSHADFYGIASMACSCSRPSSRRNCCAGTGEKA
jgi:hypothetical protein